MSQDTALFSVRRPRETLGGINYNTSIPQPASALKRSNSISGMNQNPPFTSGHHRSISASRASLALPRPNQPMFQRSSSGTNLADLGMSVKRNSSQIHRSASGRRSYAPGSALQAPGSESTQRRSSVYTNSRTPSMGGPRQSFFQQGPVPAGVPRDPRPLKDRSYQAKIGQEILDYLTRYGFEMEMKHSLTQNTMKSPTQKDFNYIFQWLYHRIDPSYRFQKNIDQEVTGVLKQLRYPYEKSITKSQIAAVGGQNWSTILGMLHWMMQLAVMLEHYERGNYDEACAEAGVDVGGDRIIFTFLSSAYRDWLQVGDDDGDDEGDKAIAPHVEAMAAEFNKSTEKYTEELSVLEAENKSLQEQIEQFEKLSPDVAKLDRHFTVMQEDREKFEVYNATMSNRLEKLEGRIKVITAEIEKVEIELRDAEREKTSLQESVDRQGITIQDIDRMNTERERLQKGVEATVVRLEEVKKKVAEKEVEANNKLEELEREVEKYNSLGYRIGLIPSTASNAKGQNYELAITVTESHHFSSSQLGGSQLGGSVANDSNRLLVDSVTGYQAHHLLNLDLRGTVKNSLIGLRKEINERRGTALEADMRNRDLLDHIKEAIDDKQSEVDALDHKVRAAEEEFDKTKEITTTQKLASDTQIEKMEKELAKMRAGLTESIQLMDQREINTKLEYEQLVHSANELREELHTEIERMLNDIIKFKVHIQKSLEDFEGFVVDVEQEQDGGASELEIDGIADEC
ncbi:MAG: kinetochore-associated Ndc80 complex subunit ndc80 [Trichoglossum hirsutum]|nr:MAG: kinetochore-associated Ndc80 complex subunit ndc80 [Trichoglossum hirsutum]